MNNTIGIKIKSLRKENHLTQEQLAEKLNCKFNLNIDRAMISKWETGYQIPVIKTLKCLADFFQVSLDYLNNNDSTGDKDSLAFSGVFPVQLKKFPMLGEISCGEPKFADEDRESYVMAGADIRADFCLKARGDSMINARITDGDIIFIRQQQMVENGEIAAVIIEDEATLKRFYFYPEKSILILKPENPKYEDLILQNEDLERVRVLGKAVAFQSDVR